jgi:hypothetical protein
MAGNTKWVKGMESPNGKGRKPGSRNFIKELKESIARVEKANGGNPITDHYVNMVWNDPACLEKLIRKLIPDLSSVQSDVTMSGQLNVLPPVVKDNDGKK